MSRGRQPPSWSWSCRCAVLPAAQVAACPSQDIGEWSLISEGKDTTCALVHGLL